MKKEEEPNNSWRTNRHERLNLLQHPFNRAAGRTFNVVRRAKQGASCQMKDLMFQNLASRNYRVLQLC